MPSSLSLNSWIKIAHRVHTNSGRFNKGLKNRNSSLKRHQSKFIIDLIIFSDTINRAQTNYMDADLKKSETIKSKVDELRTRYEAVQKESTRLREEISRL